MVVVLVFLAEPPKDCRNCSRPTGACLGDYCSIIPGRSSLRRAQMVEKELVPLLDYAGLGPMPAVYRRVFPLGALPHGFRRPYSWGGRLFIGHGEAMSTHKGRAGGVHQGPIQTDSKGECYRDSLLR